MVKDITNILDRHYNSDLPEVTTKEWMGGEYYYYKLFTEADAVERYNFHGDYWGDADGYQEQNVNLMLDLQGYVGQRVKVDYGGGDCIEGTLVGIMVDEKYNSIGHTCVLLGDDVIEGEGW